MFGHIFSSSGSHSPRQAHIISAGSNRVELAEHAARDSETSLNRVYTLTSAEMRQHPGRKQRFIAVGCQGSGDKAATRVARQINALCNNADSRPDFILILGDNIYDWGADSADDPNIRKCFDDIFQRPEFQNLQHMPFFIVLGNHDENLQKPIKAKIKSESGIKRGLHEVAHTYLGDHQFSYAARKYIYDQPELQLDNLPAWNMPHRYYALIHGDEQIFCLDSNTYVKDYLDLLLHPDTMNAQNNQAAWLAAETAKARAAGRKIIFAQHHPLFTQGKRAFHNDLNIYLKPAEIDILSAKLNINVNKHTTYNFCLKECFRQQKMDFDLLLAAHDHNSNYYNNKNNPDADYRVCQFTAGAGGDEMQLQDRVKFSAQQDMGCFIKMNSVLIVEHKPAASEIDIQLQTTDGHHHLKFNQLSREAIIHYNVNDPETPKIKRFLAVVQEAIDMYLLFLDGKQEIRQGNFFGQNFTHGKKGAERAHLIWAYLKHTHPKSFKEIIRDIHHMTAWENPLTIPADHSLITILDQRMLTHYGKTMEEFARLYGSLSHADSSGIEMNILF